MWTRSTPFRPAFLTWALIFAVGIADRPGRRATSRSSLDSSGPATRHSSQPEALFQSEVSTALDHLEARVAQGKEEAQQAQAAAETAAEAAWQAIREADEARNAAGRAFISAKSTSELLEEVKRQETRPSVNGTLDATIANPDPESPRNLTTDPKADRSLEIPFGSIPGLLLASAPLLFGPRDEGSGEQLFDGSKAADNQQLDEDSDVQQEEQQGQQEQQQLLQQLLLQQHQQDNLQSVDQKEQQQQQKQEKQQKAELLKQQLDSFKSQERDFLKEALERRMEKALEQERQSGVEWQRKQEEQLQRQQQQDKKQQGDHEDKQDDLEGGALRDLPGQEGSLMKDPLEKSVMDRIPLNNIHQSDSQLQQLAEQRDLGRREKLQQEREEEHRQKQKEQEQQEMRRKQEQELEQQEEEWEMARQHEKEQQEEKEQEAAAARKKEQQQEQEQARQREEEQQKEQQRAKEEQEERERQAEQERVKQQEQERQQQQQLEEAHQKQQEEEKELEEEKAKTSEIERQLAEEKAREKAKEEELTLELQKVKQQQQQQQQQQEQQQQQQQQDLEAKQPDEGNGDKHEQNSKTPSFDISSLSEKRQTTKISKLHSNHQSQSQAKHQQEQSLSSTSASEENSQEQQDQQEKQEQQEQQEQKAQQRRQLLLQQQQLKQQQIQEEGFYRQLKDAYPSQVLQATARRLAEEAHRMEEAYKPKPKPTRSLTGEREDAEHALRESLAKLHHHIPLPPDPGSSVPEQQKLMGSSHLGSPDEIVRIPVSQLQLSSSQVSAPPSQHQQQQQQQRQGEQEELPQNGRPKLQLNSRSHALLELDQAVEQKSGSDEDSKDGGRTVHDPRKLKGDFDETNFAHREKARRYDTSLGWKEPGRITNMLATPQDKSAASLIHQHFSRLYNSSNAADEILQRSIKMMKPAYAAEERWHQDLSRLQKPIQAMRDQAHSRSLEFLYDAAKADYTRLAPLKDPVFRRKLADASKFSDIRKEWDDKILK